MSEVFLSLDGTNELRTYKKFDGTHTRTHDSMGYKSELWSSECVKVSRMDVSWIQVNELTSSVKFLTIIMEKEIREKSIDFMDKPENT